MTSRLIRPILVRAALPFAVSMGCTAAAHAATLGTTQHTNSPSLFTSVILAMLAAVVVWAVMRAKKPAGAQPAAGSFPTFSTAAPAVPPPVASPFASPYPPYGGATPSPTFGSNLAGGLATGLGAGAGMMAAEAIGHRLFGGSSGGSDYPIPYTPGRNFIDSIDSIQLDDPSRWNDGPADLSGLTGSDATDWSDGGGTTGEDDWV